MPKYHILLNDCDTGEIELSAEESYIGVVEPGLWIETSYRGSFIGSGGFWVENMERDYVARGDRGGRFVRLTGRGALSYLERAIVWSTTAQKVSYTGKSAAYILIDQFTAAQARGALPALRWDFTASVDSDGEAWTDSHTLDFQVGTSLLDMVRQFADMGIDFYCQVDLPTQDVVLFAFANPYGSDVSSTVVFHPGKDILSLVDIQISSEMRNAYIVERADGLSDISDATSISERGRREAKFSAGSAPTEASAEALAQNELDQRKAPQRQIRLRIQDRADVFPKAFVDYDIGDTIGVDFAYGSVASAYRIRGMELDWNTDDGKAEITLLLNNIILEQQIRQGQLLRRIATGTSAGATTTSTPIDSVARLDLHDTDGNAHASHALDNDLGGTLGAPEVLKINGIPVPDPLTMSYDNQLLVYNSGTNAFIVGSAAVVVATTNPTSAANGQLCYNIADAKLYCWASGAWQAI